MKLFKLFVLLLCVFSAKGQITLEDLYQNYTYYPKGIEQMRSVGDGFFTTLSNKKGLLLRKYADRKFKQVLLDSLVVENKRVFISDYELSADREKVLLITDIEPIYRHSFKATVFVMNLRTKKTVALGGKVQEATFSPDGTKVAYVRDNDIFVYDLDTADEIQVTNDGKFREIINGLPDWVYEEEFAFSRAFEWSPDGKQLAYMKFDERDVPVYTLYFYNEDTAYPRLYSYKYPKAGEKNATVSVWVYDFASKENTAFPIAENSEQYIPRIFWTKGTYELLILRLNRHQNKLEYLMANTRNGKVENVYTETNRYFVDATNFDAITFLDEQRFAFLSEQDGYNNLYTYNYKTNTLAPWLRVDWDITSFYGIDGRGTAYFQAATQEPYNREIVSVTTDGSMRILTKEKGFHNANFDKDFVYWIDVFSSVDTPLIYKVKSNDTEYVLEDNWELLKKWKQLDLPRKEFIELPSADISVKLSAWRILPKDFDKTKRYPVLITQYNGPNSQQVQNRFSIGWYDYLVQNGFIVYCVDTRGTAARGEEFRKQTYMQLGKLESDDMIAVGKYLQSLPYVDDLTIWGWSYGGFMSSLCLMKGEGVFTSAIAVAPVTHWKFYDSVYTERYMRTPQENPEGYNANSPLGNYKKLLRGHNNLLLVHGTADDNVHIQNTYALTAKMVVDDIPFSMQIYTDKNHSIYGGKTRLHLYKKFMEFLDKCESVVSEPALICK